MGKCPDCGRAECICDGHGTRATLIEKVAELERDAKAIDGVRVILATVPIRVDGEHVKSVGAYTTPAAAAMLKTDLRMGHEAQERADKAEKERDEARAEVERLKGPKLARHQPCGCIVCHCDDPIQCHGCGAKNCGTHEPGEIPDPLYETHPLMAENAELRAALEYVDTEFRAYEAEREGEESVFGEIWERVKAALPLPFEKAMLAPVGSDPATGDEILATIDAMEKAEWQYLLKTARELAKMYDGRDGVIRDFLSAVGAMGEDEGDVAMKAEAGATRRAPGGVDIRHR
jgi:hypothetical protein